MSVTTVSIILILISAMAHALVGALMKRASNKLVLRGILAATSVVFALPVALTLPFPPAGIWLILITTAVIHWVYQFFQAAAFTRGDMSIVYPVMRGGAPAMTALFAFLVLGEKLQPVEILGLIVVVCALIGFGWPVGRMVKGWHKALVLALTCAAITALYTVVDTYGMRQSPNRFAYIAWFFVLEGTGGAIMISLLHRRGFREKLARDFRGGIMAGLLGLVTYSTALYAFSLAPIAGLAALRETSVIFGALLATVWLKESFGVRRMILAVVLAGGLVLMHM